jgi:GNAT superfamily N-acetyltransferase
MFRETGHPPRACEDSPMPQEIPREFPHEMARGLPYEVDDDPRRIDHAVLCRFLTTQAYWGRWRTPETIVEQVRASWRVVGAYRSAGDGPGDPGAEEAPAGMVGFARAVSDGFAIAYLADVFVLPEHRGRGLGHLLVSTMIDAGPGRTFRWLLHTSDAHGLYADYGFAAPDATLLERPARRAADPGAARAAAQDGPDGRSRP